MKQTNVTYCSDEQSKKMLAKFEEISTKDNLKDISPDSTSIKIICKCGCMHVEHFNVSETKRHYERHHIELCEKHSVNFNDK